LTEYGTVLADGSALVVRPIRPDDKDRLQDGFRKLSPESRYRRFFTPIDHLSEQQLVYLTEVDFENHFAWIAVLRDEPGAPAIGVGRWIRMNENPAQAEAAVTVLDAYQRQGLGGTLMWLLARSALERGIRSFSVWVLAENQPMINILTRLYAQPGPLERTEKRWLYELPVDSGVLDMFPPRLPLIPLGEE
jgi:GNAT superfamily N-acetyltransferase